MRSQTEPTLVPGSTGGGGRKAPSQTPMPARLGRYELIRAEQGQAQPRDSLVLPDTGASQLPALPTPKTQPQ